MTVIPRREKPGRVASKPMLVPQTNIEVHCQKPFTANLKLPRPETANVANASHATANAHAIARAFRCQRDCVAVDVIFLAVGWNIGSSATPAATNTPTTKHNPIERIESPDAIEAVESQGSQC